MSETVKLPGIGNVKREYVYIGAALTAGIVGYAYYRRRQDASAAVPAASTDTSASDADQIAAEGDSSGFSAIDPETGYDYGSFADQTALGQLSGGTVAPVPAPTPVMTYPAPSGTSDTPYSTSVDLGWLPVTGATEYAYQVASAAGNAAPGVDSTTTATRAAVPNLKPKTSYRWRVSVSGGSWSPWIPFTTKA